MDLTYEDTLSALHGKSKTDKRPPFSIWKHFPKEDRYVNRMVKAHLSFQESYQPDLMKISPHGRFCTVDWGCVVPLNNIDPVNGSTR
ncbi:MAG: hypothetical protein ACXAC7_12965, partial [Candidatus Hodarchaeales archaeon]